MSRRIRVVAQTNDPVVMNRLVRLLIAQAQIELKKQQIKAEVERARQDAEPREQAS